MHFRGEEKVNECCVEALWADHDQSLPQSLIPYDNESSKSHF